MKSPLIPINLSTQDPTSAICRNVETDDGVINHQAAFIHPESVIAIIGHVQRIDSPTITDNVGIQMSEVLFLGGASRTFRMNPVDLHRAIFKP